jgi:hypothetical protein
MPLELNKEKKCINLHSTNLFYLQNMTSLQMELLKKIYWVEEYKVIQDRLWSIPNAWVTKEDAKYSIKFFIAKLDTVIMEL